ncbi:MAG: hypothetical protein RIC52_12365 [Amphiplicatus sp.]
MTVTVFRQAFVIVALALAAVRGVIAPGLMIAVNPAEGLQIVLCSAHGDDERFVLTADGDLVPESELPAGESLDDLCPFASAPHAFAAVAPLIFAAPLVFIERAEAILPASVSIGRGLAAPPPPALAPPLSR